MSHERCRGGAERTAGGENPNPQTPVRISQAANADELWRARSRVAGSVLGMEKVEVQDAARIQGLYDTFEESAKARRQEVPSNT